MSKTARMTGINVNGFLVPSCLEVGSSCFGATWCIWSYNLSCVLLCRKSLSCQTWTTFIFLWCTQPWILGHRFVLWKIPPQRLLINHEMWKLQFTVLTRFFFHFKKQKQTWFLSLCHIVPSPYWWCFYANSCPVFQALLLIYLSYASFSSISNVVCVSFAAAAVEVSTQQLMCTFLQ